MEAIFLTHSHIDHTNLVDDLVREYNCDVYITDVEARYYGFDCRNIRYITGERSIFIDDITVNVISAPGHSVGGCIYLVDNLAFTGDTLFIEGCGICDSYGGSARSMFETLNRLKFMLNSDTLIYPGHRYGKELGMPFGEVMKQNVYLQFDNYKVFERFRMRKNALKNAIFI